TGFDEDVATGLAHQQGTAAKVDAVVLVGRHPALPERFGRIAEHGAAVQFLAVAAQGGQGSHEASPGNKKTRPAGRANMLKRLQLLGGMAEQCRTAATDAGFQAERAWQQAAEEELGAGQLAG